MFRSFCFFLVLTVFSVGLCGASFAAGSIGVVDVVKILNVSDAAKNIQMQRDSIRESFLSEISKAEQALRIEEKNLLDLRAKLSQEDYMAKRQVYEARLLVIRKEAQHKKRRLEVGSAKAMDILRDALYEAVQGIANERGFELVISNKNVIAGEKSLDITGETLERLNSTLPKIPLEIEKE